MKHNITLFYMHKFFSSFFLFGPTIILFFLESVTYAQLGIIMGLSMITSIFFEVPSGYWADTFGRKKLVLIGEMIGVLELATLIFFQNFYGFAISGILGGLASACISGADSSLLYDSMSKEQLLKRKQIFGNLRAFRYLAIIIAALIGAPLFGISKELPLALTIVSVIVSISLFSFIKEPSRKTRSTTVIEKLNIKSAFKILLKSQKAQHYIFFGIVSGVFIWIFHDLFTAPFYTQIGVPIAFLGVITATITFVRIFFSLKAETIEKVLSEKKTKAILLFFPGILLLAIGITNNFFSILLAIVLYCIWSVQEVLSDVYIHENIPSKQRATLFSIYSLLLSLSLLVGGVVFGYIAEIFGLAITLISLGVANIVFGILMQFSQLQSLTK